MATKTLSFQKRARSLFGGWESDYTTSTGSDLLDEEIYAISYKFSPYKGSDVQTINSFAFTAVLGGDWAQECTYDLFLYTKDPAGYDSQPTNYIDHTSGSTRVYDPSTGRYVLRQYFSWDITKSVNSYSKFYILIMVKYGSGQVTLNHGSSSIVETYTAKALPQIAFGTISADASGMKIPIVNGSNYTLTCVITAGNDTTSGNNAELYRGTSSSGRFDVPINAVQWFNAAGITNSLSIPLTIKVTGNSPNALNSSGTYQENRQASIDSMKPVVSSISTQIQQAAGAASQLYPNTYIAGYSKCKVTAVITRPTLATISTVYLSYPGGRTVTMTEDDPINSPGTYSGTTFSALAKDTEFTVSVTDERGLRNTDTAQVTGVVPYVLPSVSIDPANTYRCNSEGVKTNGGNHYKIKVTAQINTSLPNNAITELTVGLKGAPAVERHTITDGTTSDTLPPASAGNTGTLPDPKKAYVLTIIIQDRISGQVVREYTLKGMQRDMVLAHHGGVTQLGVGTTPEEENQNSVELPKDGVFLLGGIPAQAFNIPYSDSTDGSSFGKDFLSVNYEERTAATNASAYFFIIPDAMKDYVNYPVMSYDGHDDFYKDYGWVGFRTVSILNEYTALVQVIEFLPMPGRIWINAHVQTTTGQLWSGWKYHPPTVIT